MLLRTLGKSGLKSLSSGDDYFVITMSLAGLDTLQDYDHDHLLVVMTLAPHN